MEDVWKNRLTEYISRKLSDNVKILELLLLCPHIRIWLKKFGLFCSKLYWNKMTEETRVQAVYQKIYSFMLKFSPVFYIVASVTNTWIRWITLLIYMGNTLVETKTLFLDVSIHSILVANISILKLFCSLICGQSSYCPGFPLIPHWRTVNIHFLFTKCPPKRI